MSDSRREGSTDATEHGGSTDRGRGPTRATSRDRRRPAAAFAVVVLAVSLVPVPDAGGESAGGGHGILEAVAGVIAPTDPFHFVGYAVLAALSAGATGRDSRGLVVAGAVAVAFGFGVELLQIGVPWRTFAWRDSLVNAVGATAGVLAVAVRAVRGKRTSKEQTS